MVNLKMSRGVLVAGMILALFSAPVAAGGSKVRFGLAWSGPNGGRDVFFTESTPTSGGANVDWRRARVELADAVGVRMDWEIPVTPRIGLDVGASRVRHDVEAASLEVRGFLPTGGALPDDLELEESGRNPAETFATLDMTAVTVGVLFHPLQDERFDFFVGPQMAYVQYGNLKTADSAPEWFPRETAVKNELTHGAVVGFDWRLGRTDWFISGALQYLHTDAVLERPGGGLTVGVESWLVHAGVGYRFRGE
jgi:hypothetical protein